MDEENFKIKDIPSLKKLLKETGDVATLKQMWPLLRIFFQSLGVDVYSMGDSLANVDDLVRAAEELTTIPDRFNDLFSDHGWIMYDSINLEVAKDAIKLAENGDFAGAEKKLLDYYSSEEIAFQLRRMLAVKAFRPRMDLATKALKDFQEGRYYSSILVILSLLDGMVNEIQHRGFFSEKVDLRAWDSVAAHNKGLQKLTALFNQGRQKTRTEEITLPYRNGIIHGMDLGYDNRIVAVKVWAALFATRDWALKAERNELEAKPPEEKESLTEIIKKFKEISESKEILKNWKPRKLKVGIDIPASGEPSQYTFGSPEQVLVTYLNFWKVKNYGFMKNLLSQHLFKDFSPKEIREEYEDKSLMNWEIIAIDDQSPAITEITLKIDYEVGGTITSVERNVRMIYEDGDDFGVVRNRPDGKWALVSWVLL